MGFSRRDFKLLGLGLLVGGSLVVGYGKIEWNYWQSPGWWFSEVPRLHAWAIRLMEIGHPG